LDGLGNILDQEDRTPLNKADKLPCVCVCGGIEGLICKTHDCNQGTQPDVPLGERTDTHRLQNNNHTLQTTNIQASSADYTHVETRMHLPSYRVHVANAYKPWPVALVREDEPVIVSVVENSAQKVKYDARDSEVDPKDTLLQSKPVYIFDRLCQALNQGQFCCGILQENCFGETVD